MDGPVRRVARPAAWATLFDRGQLLGWAVVLGGSLTDVLDAQLVGRPARDDGTVRHHRDVVGEPLGLLDVVRRHEHGRALRAQCVDQRPQLLAHLGVETHRRLVEQHELRGVHEPACDRAVVASCRRRAR